MIRPHIFNKVLLVEEERVIKLKSASFVGTSHQGTKLVVTAFDGALVSGKQHCGAFWLRGEPPVVGKPEPPISPSLSACARTGADSKKRCIESLLLCRGPLHASLLGTESVWGCGEVEKPLPSPPRVPWEGVETEQVISREWHGVVVDEVLCVVSHHHTLPGEEIECGVFVEEEGMCLDVVSSQDQLEGGLLGGEKDISKL